MAVAEEPPLDEQQWRSPPIAQSMGGIHTNTVLPYFSHSPFFDATSNNATLTTQAMYNPNMFHFIQTREAFEGRLRTMSGLEFMVAHDPSNNGQQPENSGVFVIRKQNRRKRPGLEDEVTALSSYFVIGENIYMAPSVGNVIGSRMLSTVTSLTKLLSAASALPIFTPSLGHTYLPPTRKAPSSGISTQATQTSIESTPMPDTQGTLRSTKTLLASEKSSSADLLGTSILAESFSLFSRYGNEYMDENPLVGEPGSFILQKSREAPSQSQPKISSSSAKPSAPPTPQLITDLPPASGKKSAKAGEKSPITPGFKDKKGRRKSKVAGALTTTTPK